MAAITASETIFSDAISSRFRLCLANSALTAAPTSLSCSAMSLISSFYHPESSLYIINLPGRVLLFHFPARLFPIINASGP